MVKATLHVVTRSKSSGLRLWDAVWCDACVAEHRATYGGDADLSITVRPWGGSERACDSCDDSELPPELKRPITAALVLLLALLVPGLASAQTFKHGAPLGPQVAVIVGNALDTVSTEIALQRPGVREANPVLGQSTTRRLALKAAGTAAQVWLVRSIGRKHPKVAKVAGYSIGAALGGVSIWNFSR